MEKFIIANSVNSGEAREGNPEPSSTIEKVQRLIVAPSGAKRRRPGKGLWFDGEVCGICGRSDRPHHAKGVCKYCYGRKWYLENPGARSIHNHNSYVYNRWERIRLASEYYLANREAVLARVLRKYREESFDGNLIRALERDGWACRNLICPCTTDRLDVHHVDGQGVNHPEPNHSLDNLLTLCASCHGKVSMGYDIVWTVSEDAAVAGEIIVLATGVA